MTRPQFLIRLIPALLLGVLAFFLMAADLTAAPVTTATLHVSPSPTVSPGKTLKFSADIYPNQAFPHPPGSIVRVWVTRNDFSWVSDKKDIEYPGMGSVQVDFDKGFPIPGNTAAGKVFDFVLVYGIWYPISNMQSVTVKGHKFQRKQFPIRKPVPLERR